MKRNFSIPTSIELQFDNYCMDLHNDYNVLNISIQIENKIILKLLFGKNDGSWVNKNNPQRFSIIFEGVKNLEFIKDLSVPYKTPIHEIGFKNTDDKDYDWIMDEKQSSTDSNLFFWFASDEYLKIYSESANLIIDAL